MEKKSKPTRWSFEPDAETLRRYKIFDPEGLFNRSAVINSALKEYLKQRPAPGTQEYSQSLRDSRK